MASADRRSGARARAPPAAPHGTRLSFGTAAAAARGIGAAELAQLVGDLRLASLDAAAARPAVRALARRFSGPR